MMCIIVMFYYVFLCLNVVYDLLVCLHDFRINDGCMSLYVMLHMIFPILNWVSKLYYDVLVITGLNVGVWYVTMWYQSEGSNNGPLWAKDQCEFDKFYIV
jgi:hypothetical protein